MNPPTHLLAKSYDRSRHTDGPPDYARLTVHSRDVAEACAALARIVGPIVLHNSGLPATAIIALTRALKANGWSQDIGKASSHFHRLVSTGEPVVQLVRHETISGLLLLAVPVLRDWLAPLGDELVPSLWGALGHHRKFDDERALPAQAQALTVFTSHPDFREILAAMAEDLGLGPPPRFDRDLRIARDTAEPCDIDAYGTLLALFDEFADRESDFEDDCARRQLALVKSLGIAADVAASAVAARGRTRSRYSVGRFAEETLATVGLTDSDFRQLIAAWAAGATGVPVTESGALPTGFEVRPFQRDVAASESTLTLARAGCGSGKSLAAYLWASEWQQRIERAGRSNFRLVVCLPTTGTTTEHFKDYALESGIRDAALVHSRAGIDLETIAETAAIEEAPNENGSAGEIRSAALAATRDKLDSLALWGTPLVVTTADTVLGLMSNARRAIYSFPALALSAIVFDEIHAFDEVLFGHLLVFLGNFPLQPVLLMTASLPTDRLEAIQSVRPDLAVVDGPPDLEQLPRYRIERAEALDSVWQTVDEVVSQGGKVLWVRNRVDAANRTYAECRSRYPDLRNERRIDVYHSRLRYVDRSERHRRVVDGFKDPSASMILVATQVAEMSLDLSADLLVSDVAPIPALIQRMGRLNRRSTPTAPRLPMPAIVTPLPDYDGAEAPYTRDDIALAWKWVEGLGALGRALSQKDLAEEFSRLSPQRAYSLSEARERAVFFSGLWRTRPGITRGEGYTASVVLERDLESFGGSAPGGDWIRRHEVSVPIREEMFRWKRLGAGVRVAPEGRIAYDFDDNTREGTGASWLGR